jgi:hypothetical protein
MVEVVVRARVEVDLHQVHAGGRIGPVAEGTPRPAARAANRGQTQ